MLRHLFFFPDFVYCSYSCDDSEVPTGKVPVLLGEGAGFEVRKVYLHNDVVMLVLAWRAQVFLMRSACFPHA